MNDWSFTQLCRLSGVAKDTVNRLTPRTASEVFSETLPRGNKPLQLFAQGDLLRSIHTASCTRLFNADLLQVAWESVPDFQPPPKGSGGATGLYAGEQDMFCFLIDPAGWVEIQGEPFAPGFFLFNSEVGSRSVGIETFWFQKVCSNHIVWDAVEVVEFTRKHTANVSEALEDMRRLIDALVTKRDSRRDGFVKVIAKAMETKLGKDSEEVQKALSANGIPRLLAQRATEIARRQGSFSIFSLVDVLTRLSGELVNAGHRLEVDQRASRLLAFWTGRPRFPSKKGFTGRRQGTERTANSCCRWTGAIGKRPHASTSEKRPGPTPYPDATSLQHAASDGTSSLRRTHRRQCPRGPRRTFQASARRARRGQTYT